jgi:hypothetical protein
MCLWVGEVLVGGEAYLIGRDSREVLWIGALGIGTRAGAFASRGSWIGVWDPEHLVLGE